MYHLCHPSADWKWTLEVQWKSQPTKVFAHKNHHKLSFFASISFTSAGAVLPPRQEKTPGWATLKPTAPFQPQQAACRLVLRCSCSGRFIGGIWITWKKHKAGEGFQGWKKTLKKSSSHSRFLVVRDIEITPNWCDNVTSFFCCFFNFLFGLFLEWNLRFESETSGFYPIKKKKLTSPTSPIFFPTHPGESKVWFP